MSETAGFSNEQKQYLQGFVAGSEALRSQRGLPSFASTLGVGANGPPAPVQAGGASGGRGGAEDIHRQAQDRFLADGAKLVAEEQAKRDKNPFEMWDEMRARGEGRPISQRNRCFSLQVSWPVFRRPGPKRLHVPASISRRTSAMRFSFAASPTSPNAAGPAMPT